MVNKQQFYCVSCGEMLHLHEAERLFVTGFYRIEYPLGCCSACMQSPPVKERPLQSMSGQEGNARGAFDVYGTDEAKEPMLVFI